MIQNLHNTYHFEGDFKTLKGAPGTWDEGYPKIQRIAYGGGDERSH
ncbi:hypothetical protein N9M69_03410 [Flavobacteriaceae bacterium]|nr:hypothetical protein [Flavobacteriaceae bacterium]